MIEKIKSLKFLKIILLIFSSFAFSCCNNIKLNSKPNIVLILVDDLGWADVGCYGNNYYETPNIDRLADNGIKFNNAYAACAVCSPTRASIMTGRYPTRIGITDWIHHWYPIIDDKQPVGYESSAEKKLKTPKNYLFLDHDEITIAEILKNAGYTTCHIGKWHLGQKKWYPESQGFDYNIGGFEMGQPPSYFDPYKNPTLVDRKEGEYLTDREADEAVSFIKTAVGENIPFFLYMSHYAVHTPIQAKKEIIEHYQNKEIPNNRDFHPEYAAMVQSVDEAVGTITSILQNLGISDNTIIIFTSDNGGLKLPQGNDSNYVWTDNSPLRAGKGSPYEGGIRVPFIVKWPGKIEPESYSDEIISSIDILPTICNILGQKPPNESKIDGKNLIPVFTKKGDIGRKNLYWHFPHYWGGGVPPYSIIRDGDWKLIHWYENNSNELYNLKDDPSETKNLAEIYHSKISDMSEKLNSWLIDTGGKLPQTNQEYVEEKKINHIAVGKKINLAIKPSSKYSQGNKNLLVNGIMAPPNLNEGWIGFEGNDLIANVDLGSLQTINSVSINFLQNQKEWIFLPVETVFYASKDGHNFSKLRKVLNNMPAEKEGIVIKKFSIAIHDEKLRYLKIHAKNLGICPQWHSGAGCKAWLFCDEIIVEKSN